MKKLLIGLLLISSCVKAQLDFDKVLDKPSKETLVVDKTGTFSKEEIKTLEEKLQKFYKTDTVQILLLAVNSVKPYSMMDYATTVGRKFGIGSKLNNKGVVFLWAKGDRKTFISPSSHLSGVIPDALAKRILKRSVSPLFKKDRFYEGVDSGTDELIGLIKQENQISQVPSTTSKSNSGLLWFCLVVIIILLFGGLILLYLHIKDIAEQDAKELDRQRLQELQNQQARKSSPSKRVQNWELERSTRRTTTYVQPIDSDDSYRKKSDDPPERKKEDDTPSYGGSVDYNGGGAEDDY